MALVGNGFHATLRQSPSASIEQYGLKTHAPGHAVGKERRSGVAFEVAMRSRAPAGVMNS